MRIKILVITLSLLVLFVIVILIFWINRPDFIKNTHHLGYIDTCEVRTFKESSADVSPYKMEILSKFIFDNKIKCINNSIYLYQPDDRVAYGMKGRIMLSRCTVKKNNTGEFAACNDYYVKGYKQ